MPLGMKVEDPFPTEAALAHLGEQCQLRLAMVHQGFRRGYGRLFYTSFLLNFNWRIQGLNLGPSAGQGHA